MNWDLLVDESTLLSVLPAEYARFSRPLSDGLRVFLSGLSPVRQQSVLAEQARLGLSASTAERLAVLARTCPVLHKLGQVLARDQRLPVALRRELQKLESLSPSVPLEAIEAILAKELGGLESLGVELQPPAIAEASVAVVIPFVRSDGREGVFKVLKPGIEERLEEELGLLSRVGRHLDQECDELGIPHLDYQESFEQVRDKLLGEIRLDIEQRHLREAREAYASDSFVQIPEVYDYCTRRVTAMQRMHGGKITDQCDSPGSRKMAAWMVIESLIAKPMFSLANQAPFHCDPHAGNLFFDGDRIAILDWSLVGTLGERERVAMVQIMLAAATMHSTRIVSVLEGLAERQTVDRAALTQVVDAALRRIRRGQFPGLEWIVGMLDEAVQHARLRVSADLMLFRKSLHTLQGVLVDLGVGGSWIDQVLLCVFVKHMVMEWPSRWLALPHSREFATRLSNADLASLMLSIPWATTRFWRQQFLDLARIARTSTNVAELN